jgi:hypothetical protein
MSTRSLGVLGKMAKSYGTDRYRLSVILSLLLIIPITCIYAAAVNAVDSIVMIAKEPPQIKNDSTSMH